MHILSFDYDNIEFRVLHDTIDKTGFLSIFEIIKRDDYQLSKFANLKDKVLIDIGANLGVATIIMAKLNPESIVYSFEPYQKAFDLLLKNIELNNLSNVKAFNLAVTNKSNKSLLLSIFNDMTGASSTYADEDKFKKTYAKTSNQQVDCISFDDIIINNYIQEIELLKIDCEGAEFDIIYDSEFIKKGIVKNIVGEFHDLEYNKGTGNNDSKQLINYTKQYVKGMFNISIAKITL